MVDIHSHILPNVDDGASSWETSVRMCQMAAEDGTTHIVATPHANDEFVYDRAHLEELLAELKTRTGGILRFSLGCDFHLSYENLVELDRDPHRFTISGTDYLLVELSDFSIAPWVTTRLSDLVSSGIKPVITHPERNMILQKKPEQVLEWASMGCPVQVTANSLTGRWGEKAFKVAQWLLRNESVHIIASDCHNLESRSPVLSQAYGVLEKTYGAELATALVTDNPHAVVENRPLPYFPS
jgi:protein-tyrosine phosphatase